MHHCRLCADGGIAGVVAEPDSDLCIMHKKQQQMPTTQQKRAASMDVSPLREELQGHARRSALRGPSPFVDNMDTSKMSAGEEVPPLPTMASSSTPVTMEGIEVMMKRLFHEERNVTKTMIETSVKDEIAPIQQEMQAAIQAQNEKIEKLEERFQVQTSSVSQARTNEVVIGGFNMKSKKMVQSQW